MLLCTTGGGWLCRLPPLLRAAVCCRAAGTAELSERKQLGWFGRLYTGPGRLAVKACNVVSTIFIHSKPLLLRKIIIPEEILHLSETFTYKETCSSWPGKHHSEATGIPVGNTFIMRNPFPYPKSVIMRESAFLEEECAS